MNNEGSSKKKQRGRSRDKVLAKEMGRRIESLYGDNKVGSAKKLGIKHNTLWSYMKGVCMPGLEVLILMSQLSGVPIDWILKGEKSTVAPFSPEVFTLARNIQKFSEACPDETRKAFTIIEACINYSRE